MLGFKRFDTAAVTISALSLRRKSESTSSRSATFMVNQRRFRQSGQPLSPSNLRTGDRSTQFVLFLHLHQNHSSLLMESCFVAILLRHSALFSGFTTIDEHM